MTIRKGKTIIAGNIPAGYEIGDIGLSAIGIDESLNYRRYLNGQEILQAQFPEFTKKIKRRVELYPSLACSDYQYETYLLTSAHGQCGKFVIDDERGVIRLPKVVNVMGLSDMAEAGVTVDAGLPNITGKVGVVTYGSTTAQTSGAFAKDGAKLKTWRDDSTGSYPETTFDASRSNPIYGNSETVQQEAIKYPYFIQVASSSETTINLTRDIELNNPFSLFEYKFSEYAIDNISWLESKGQWNSNKVYVSAYEELLAIYNGKEREGVSVKKTTETYTDYDFVIDEAGSAFRLPLKVLGASSKAVVGNGMTLGLTDGTTNAGVYFNGHQNSLYPSAGAYGANLPAETGEVSPYNNTSVIGVTTDPNYSGIETSTEGMKLYFYVGETVQDSNLINAGAVLEDVNTLKNTALTNNQITNCITEMPQRVKLELADGVLTLKAGSEVIVPNGFEEDGVTPKFDYVTIESNLTDIADTQRQAMTWCAKFGENYFITAPMPLAYCYSGSIAPSSFYADGLALWYDTSTNFVKYTTNSGATWDNQGHSLPFAIVTETTTSYSSIDQVFNGMGFIGKHRWVDKGIKYLLPKGRNEDGTLRNIEAVTTNIQVMDGSTKISYHVFLRQTDSFDYGGMYYEQEEKPIVIGSHAIWFNTKENIIDATDDGGATWYKLTCSYAGKLEKTTADSNFTSIDTKQPFRALDYSDKSTVSGWGMPSSKYIDLTAGASGTTYTAPANGYFYISKQTGTTDVRFLNMHNVTRGYYLVEWATNGQATNGYNILLPVTKNDIVSVTYNFTGTTDAFRFIYAEGEK